MRTVARSVSIACVVALGTVGPASLTACSSDATAPDFSSASDAGDASASGSDSGTSSGAGSSSGGSSGSGSSSGASSSSGSGSGGGSGSSSGGGSGSSSGSGSGSSSSSSSGGSSGGTIDAGDGLAAARAQCVQIINMDRATLTPAAPPLTEDTAQETCVDGQAKADYTANTPHSAFGNCNEYAQDECPGWPGPPSSIMTGCLAQMWAEGPPPQGQDNHWLNMSNASYTKVACGFYQTPKGDWWATQDFW